MVEIISLSVERGFSNSDNKPQLPSIDPWEGWTRALDEFTLMLKD